MPADLLLLWNDIDERRRPEYDCWHSIEHVPERTWVSGFRCATRYEFVEGRGARYLTSYELDRLNSLESAEYRSLVEHPTPWSASMRPSLRNFLRRTYVGQAEMGRSLARFMWARRMVWPEGDARSRVEPSVWQQLAGVLERQGARSACVTRVQVGLQQPSGTQAIANVDEAPPGIEVVVLLHHAAPAELSALSAMVDGAAARALPKPIWVADARYALLSTVRHDDVRSASRPEPREDLRSMAW